MDEKEMDNSSAPHKRSKSVPSMSPVNFNSTQLQDQPIVGRSRSNTVDSAERLLVRTQRRGARLSSGGLLRNQSKKRRNKNGLEKSRSIDVVDRDDKNESSRKSNNPSESSEVHEQEQTIIRARKQGFCLPAVNSVVETLKTMDDEQEFPNNIDPDQTNFAIVCSANEKSLLADQHLTLTTTLHDHNETLKISEDEKPHDNLRTSERTDNRREPEEIAQGQMLNLRKDWNTNIRRRSLPADLSDYQIDSNLGDYNEGHEYHTTRLTNDSQTDMKFQNNYRIVYRKRCQNNWRRWHSLPEVNENESDSTDLVSNTLDHQETSVLVETVDQESSNVQDPRQSHENGNTILNISSENLKDKATMAAEMTVIHEQQQSLNSEENSNIKKSDTNKKSNKILRSYSLPTRFDVVDRDERQGKKIEELKRTKSLTADEFDEVFPLMLSEQSTSKLEPDNAKFNDDLKEGCNLDEKSFVHEKPKRKRRRRAKSLPVTLVLEEIPEESPEDYSCDQYESVEDMAKKHVNRAFQDLLRKIQASRQRPRKIKVKRSRSLSTIKETVVSSEALHELEQSRDENVAAQEKTRKEHETEQGTTDNEQKHVHENTHHEDDDQHEQYEEKEKINDIYDEANEQVFEDPQEQENNINKEDDLQQSEKQADYLLMNKDVQASQKSLKEQLKLQPGESAEHETLAVPQETQENNEGEQEQKANGYDLHDNAAQEGTVMNESLAEQVNEEKSSLQKAKEELHIDIPQILISDVGLEQCQNTNADTYVRDVHDDVDGSEEQEGSGEYSKTIPQTEELKSPDDEDIQGTILEHINNMEFCEFEHSISQRSIVNVVSCMERIPEDPDKETALESTETESKLIKTVKESIQDEFDLAETELDSTDGKEEQSTLKRAGSMRRGKSPRGKSSGPSSKKSWPLANDTGSEQSNREQKRVTWSDVTHGPTESESDQEDQEDGYQDQYEPGPRGNISFIGFNDSYTSQITSSNQLDISQDEYEEGPTGEFCFIAGSADEHASPDNKSELDETISYHPHSDELQMDPVESKFDVLVRNAINSYLEPDYSQSESPIHKAVATGSVGHLKELIKDGADVNALDEHGWPPLHVATLFNKVDCAALLLEAGADLKGYTDSLIHEYQTLREKVCK